MADVPTPRSYSAILSDIIDAFLSRFGIQRLEIGSPLLSILEAAAQSDVRSSQDIFNLLDSLSIDRASGVALSNIAADENLTRIPVTSSTGLVNFSDTSFAKISSSVYQGASAPNIGTTALKVTDASSFPTSGSLYIGRGTVNFEGPIVFTAVTNIGPYWEITLSTGTTKFHNLGESVILAQGGLRLIPAGTVVQTPQGNVSDAVKFSTLYNAQIEDGEVLLVGVEVVAQQPGVIGNVPSGAIKEVIGSPYLGAAVTNPLPFTNGLPEEDDPSLRERIKNARQSRQKGTALALVSGVKGVSSTEDNKTVISAAIVDRQNEATTLFIDDGTGYEETVDGVAQEILMDSALGGEQLFQLSSQRPVARAFLETTITAPFSLTSGDKLSVKVGGIRSEHTFSTSEFKSISNATAYEVVASINGNSTLSFSARTSNSGTKVVIFGKTDVNEDIEVVEPLIGNNSNPFLGFPVGVNYTLRLYKNDQFLYKDGKSAIITSNPQNLWSPTITSGDTLQIQVDNTAVQTLTFTNADFINNDTGFTTVSSTNTAEAWAIVFNAKITGVTTTGENSLLTLVSNIENSSRAALLIVGGTLVSKGMFISGTSAVGADNDYSLDRNTGQLKLEVPLVEGDSLVAATEFTRAYLQSQEFASSSLTISPPDPARLWFAVDGNAEILNTGVTAGTTLTITSLATNRARYTAITGTFGDSSFTAWAALTLYTVGQQRANGANLYEVTVGGTSAASGGPAGTRAAIIDGTVTWKFVSVLAFVSPGDWVVVWDPAFTDQGAWRISDIAGAPNFEWFEVERSVVTAEAAAPSVLGIIFARTLEQLQHVEVPVGSYSMTSLADNLNTQLVGATATVFRNTKLRVATNTFPADGDIMLITADIEGQKLLLPDGELVVNNPSHFAVIESSNSEIGTPNFKWTTVATVPTATTFTMATEPEDLVLRSGDIITYRKRLNVAANDRYGTNAHDHQIVETISTLNVITPRVNVKSSERLVNDRLYSASPFAIASDDNLSIVLDKDEVTKNYNIPLYRNIVPAAGAVYGTTPFEVRDADNSNASLYDAFARTTPDTTFFDDFALFMHARGKSHSITTQKTILWRFGRYGSEGNLASVGFLNPSEPNASFSLVTNVDDGDANIGVVLPSGSERLGMNVNGGNPFVVATNTLYSAAIGNVARVGTTVTVTLAPAGVTNVHALAIGDQVFQNTTEANFPSGPKKVTGITANTFTYTEAGAAVVSTVLHTYTASKRPAGTDFVVTALSSSGTHITATIGAHIFTAGDTVYFQPGHFDTGSGILIAAGQKLVTSVAATTVTWAEVAAAGAAVLIAGVDYTVSSGQCEKATLVYFKAEVAVGALTRVGNVVTATMNTTPLISTHPFLVGDVAFLAPGEANFPAGAKIITAVTLTTFSYVESGAAVSSTAVQRFSTTNTDPNFAAPLVVGDIVHVDENSSLDPEVEGDFRVFAFSSSRIVFLRDNGVYTGDTVPRKINNILYLRFYPIDTAASTAAQVVTFINLPANNLSNVVSAALVPDNSGAPNTGTAPIDMATIEEFYLTTNNASIEGSGQQSLAAWPFFDGINWVRATNLVGPASSTISLKDPVAGELTANAAFTSENMRLVPILVQNFINYLGSTGVSGFAANSIITSSTDGKKLQIGSSTIGSDGSVEVTDGTGNFASATIFGTGEEILISGIPTYSKVTVPVSQTKGLTGDQSVSIQGSSVAPKVTPWGSANSMAIVSTINPDEWLIQFSGGTLASRTAVDQIQAIGALQTYQVEKHGNFMAYIDASTAPTALSASISEGDWVYIVAETLNAVNTGLRQVVRVDTANNTFWVENPDGVEEIATFVAGEYVKFFTYDSVMPGDSFIISTDIFGTQNIGTFVVNSLSESGLTTTATEFIVTGEMVAIGATLLGSNYVFVKVKEASPIKLIKEIRTINISDNDDTFADIIFNTAAYASKMSSAVGSVILPLDKLAFNTDINVGLDGYSFNTGLLAEVNKVVYGDETNPAVYPGIIASGANVNISGPLVKRINVSLAIRLRTGLSYREIIDRVKSAVASVINSTPVGTSIALSDIVSAANSIDGVLAVTILSPEFSSGNDLIPVQSSEKPLVLDIETDVLVSIVS